MWLRDLTKLFREITKELWRLTKRFREVTEQRREVTEQRREVTEQRREVTEQRREVMLEPREGVLSRGDPVFLRREQIWLGRSAAVLGQQGPAAARGRAIWSEARLACRPAAAGLRHSRAPLAALARTLLALPPMNQIKLGLNHKNAAQRLAQGNAIKTALTGNADFLLPNPPLTTLDSALATLEASLAERQIAIEAAKAATEKLRAAEAVYDAVITRLAAYAVNAAAGNAAKLERGGFSVRRAGSPTRELAQVADLRVEANSFAGVLKVRWEPVRGAKVYQVQISPDLPTDTSWTTIEPSPSSSMTLAGLESGQRIWIRVRGVTRGLVGPWSQPANKIVP